jgi:chaperonin GroES
MIQPLADRVILKLLDSGDAISTGGIILGKHSNKFKVARVVAVGRGIVGNNGLIQPEVQVGDHVYVTANTGDEIIDGAEKYIVVTERTIVAIVDDPSETKQQEGTKKKQQKLLNE